MAAKKTRTRVNRRDRRKAKQSGWRRAGTTNPKKVAHHNYDTPVVVAAKGKRIVGVKRSKPGDGVLRSDTGDMSVLS